MYVDSRGRRLVDVFHVGFFDEGNLRFGTYHYA